MSTKEELHNNTTKFINGAYHVSVDGNSEKTKNIGITNHSIFPSANSLYKSKIAFCGLTGVEGRGAHHMGKITNFCSFSYYSSISFWF